MLALISWRSARSSSGPHREVASVRVASPGLGHGSGALGDGTPYDCDTFTRMKRKLEKGVLHVECDTAEELLLLLRRDDPAWRGAGHP